MEILTAVLQLIGVAVVTYGFVLAARSGLSEALTRRNRTA